MDKAAIVGLGYVGLPLAQAATAAGVSVVGFDVSERVVARLRDGLSHVDDLEDAEVATMLGEGFAPTADPADLSGKDVVVICVPTPLTPDGGPDLSAVESASHTVGRQLSHGTLVVLESTTYPGTTEDVVRPILEQESGLTAGQDFHLAFSPERVDPGNPTYGITNTPKVVGGLTPACSARAESFYGQFVDRVVTARGPREAETAKLLENTYRHINIALVNEMARFCHELDIDLWNVIECAATKPFGFQAFRPGPGVGGHCIPIDPNYLNFRVQSTLGYPFRFVELAEEINSTMPQYVASRVRDDLAGRDIAVEGARVLLLGVTYKPDISDRRESPGDHVAAALAAFGADVAYHDWYVPEWSGAGRPLCSVEDPYRAAAEHDITVLLQNHARYDLALLAEQARVLFDTRGVAEGPSVVRM